MKKLTTLAALAVCTTSMAASAAERTITLAVGTMACVVCAYNVKKSLEGVSGVVKVHVALREKIAVVVYDDTKANVTALISATTRAGFPSVPKS